MSSKTPKLIFVYNAQSGALNAVKDSLHKWLSPQTYDCNLCALTHGAVGEKKAWTAFRSKLPLVMEFYHKDQFMAEFASKWLPKYDYPVVLLASSNALELFIDAATLNQLSTLTQLETKILEKAEQFNLM